MNEEEGNLISLGLYNNSQMKFSDGQQMLQKIKKKREMRKDNNESFLTNASDTTNCRQQVFTATHEEDTPNNANYNSLQKFEDQQNKSLNDAAKNATKATKHTSNAPSLSSVTIADLLTRQAEEDKFDEDVSNLNLNKSSDKRNDINFPLAPESVNRSKNKSANNVCGGKKTNSIATTLNKKATKSSSENPNPSPSPCGFSKINKSNNLNQSYSSKPVAYKWHRYKTEQEELQERVQTFYERKWESKHRQQQEEEMKLASSEYMKILNTHPYCRQAPQEEINAAKILQYNTSKNKTNIMVTKFNQKIPLLTGISGPGTVAEGNNTIKPVPVIIQHCYPQTYYEEQQHQEKPSTTYRESFFKRKSEESQAHQQFQEKSLTLPPPSQQDSLKQDQYEQVRLQEYRQQKQLGQEQQQMQQELSKHQQTTHQELSQQQHLPNEEIQLTHDIDYLDPDDQNKVGEATSSVLHLHNMHKISRLVRENKILNRKLDSHAKKIDEKEKKIYILENELTRAKNLDTISGDIDIKNNISLLQMDLQSIQCNFINHFLEDEYAECVSHIRQIGAKIGTC